MADEQYKWLNRETAERLLRGESLEAVDASVRDQAERLSQALGALSAEAAPAPGELPGEQAALAAFRKAREAADAERTAAAHAPAAARTPAPGADAGLVRIAAPRRTGIRTARPRWARPARLALAAAVTVGTLGGVAVAAGSGVLPTPVHDDHPRPAASVSAGRTAGQPLGSGSAPATPGAGTGTPGTGTGTPDDGPDGRRGGTDDEAAGRDGDTGRGTAPGSAAPSATSGTGWRGAASACRVLRDGKELDSGRRRVLEHLAGGPARVTAYCKVLLTTGDSSSAGTGNGGAEGNSGDTTGGGPDKGKGKDQDKDKDGDRDPDKGKGPGREKDRGEGRGEGKDRGTGRGSGSGDDGPGGGKGGGRHRGGAAPAPSAFDPAHPGAPAHAPARPAPTPTYSAL
ncbi:hypothetical protein [Streptomyces tricolor]